MAIAPHEIELQPINCNCQPHACEVDDVEPAVVAVSTTDRDDPRVFMVCGRHSLDELATFLD